MITRFVNDLSRMNIRWASLLIGTIQAAWAILPMLDSQQRSLFVITLQEKVHATEWGYFMFMVGLFLSLTSILPWRRGRHIALFLSCATWLATLSIFMTATKWVLTPFTLSSPIFALFCIALLIAEAASKRTHGQK